MSDKFDDAAAWQSPQTKSLEVRLAAAVPRTSSDEQQAILYAAAFAAGAEAALVASIVHERPERLPELKAELEEAGWPMRR